MKAYIAGRMRGQPMLGFPAFDAARDLLLEMGHVPVSPADMDREFGVDGSSDVDVDFVHAALRRDFVAICDCDAIAFLPGWEESSGARAERQVAEAIGLPCWRIDPSTRSLYRESVIGLAGYARSGKDVFARFVVEHGYEQRAFATPLKGILYALDPTVHIDEGHATIQRLVDAFGWDAAKGHGEVRMLLQRLGTEGGRQHLGEDVWVDALFKSPSSGRVVVTDVRFPNEADAIRRRGGVVARVTRPGVRPVNAHRSETALDNFDFDFIVKNDGTVEDLKDRAQELVDAVEREGS